MHARLLGLVLVLPIGTASADPPRRPAAVECSLAFVEHFVAPGYVTSRDLANVAAHLDGMSFEKLRDETCMPPEPNRTATGRRFDMSRKRMFERLTRSMTTVSIDSNVSDHPPDLQPGDIVTVSYASDDFGGTMVVLSFDRKTTEIKGVIFVERTEQLNPDGTHNISGDATTARRRVPEPGLTVVRWINADYCKTLPPSTARVRAKGP